MRCNTPTPVREAGHRGSRSSLAVLFAAARGCTQCFVQFYVTILDSTALTSHSPRTRNKFVRRARVRNAADRLAMQTRNTETGEPPNHGPSKLYTLNPPISPRCLPLRAPTPRGHIWPDKRGLSPRARTRVHHAPGPRYGGRNQLSIVTLMQIVQLRARLASCRSLPGSRSRHKSKQA